MSKRPSSPSASESLLLEKKSRRESEEAANSRRRQILEIRSMLRRRSEGTTLADGCNSEKKTNCIWTSSVVKNPPRIEINTSADTEYRLSQIRKQKSRVVKNPLRMDVYSRSDMDDDEIANLVKEDRHRHAEDFRSNYTYGTSTDGCYSDKKTCISSTGTYSCLEKSPGIGIMWVAVHGIDSICVVTNDKEKLDLTRLRSLKRSTESDILDEFRETLVCEIEDLADPSCKICRSSDLDHNIKKPFGVVSVISGTDKVHEENGHEVSSVNYDGKTAIKFLEEKMNSDCAFSFNETVEATISAFQHLFHRKFKAKEIRVCVLREVSGLGCLCRSVVKEHLRVINEGTPRSILDLGWKFGQV